MTELKSPIQPFIVRYPASLSGPHLQALMELYQPIIGPTAVNLYMCLFQIPLQESKLSRPRVHSTLFTYMRTSLHYLDQARLSLEGIGLLRTYKETKNKQIYPTLLYDLSLPLLFEDFIENPLLSNTLISHIGEENFYRISKELLMSKIDLTLYEEVSVDFATVFSPTMTDYEDIIGNVKDDYESGVSSPPKWVGESQFDYDTLVKRLLAAQVHHTIFGPAFKSEIESLHLVYGLTVDHVYEYVMAAYDQARGKIILPTLRGLAQNHQAKLEKKQGLEEGQIQGSNQQRQFSEQVTKQGEIASPERALIQLMETVSPLDVLKQLKHDKQGFVTDQERRYIEELERVSDLNIPLQSFLVYYLIEVRGRSDFQKGESQRVANEWQQAGIKGVDQAIFYVRQKQNEVEQPRKNQKRKTTYTKTNKRSEVVPTWMQNHDRQERDNSSQADESSDILSQEALQNQLQALLTKEGDRK